MTQSNEQTHQGIPHTTGSKAHQELIMLTKVSLPEWIRSMKESDVAKLTTFISESVNKDDEGYEKLFESLAMMMKYVPNFILHSMIPKYIEPNIAAKITNKLTTKQVIGVASGLSVEYISATAVHMNNQLALSVLLGLKKKLAHQVLEHTVRTSPAAAYAILLHAPKHLQTTASQFCSADVEANLSSTADLNSYQKIKALA